jgi:polyisoprenoid-binding protein YceI
MTETTATRRRPALLLLALVPVVLVVAGLAWFLSGDEPAPVDLTATDGADTAADPATDPATDPLADADQGSADGTDVGDAGDAPAPQDVVGLDRAGAPSDLRDVDGIWVVDRDAQRFDREAGAGTFVGYRIDEELASLGATTAVGRTPVVDGEVELDGTTVVRARIEADLTALESDDGRRDNRVRSTFAGDGSAVFELDEPLDIGALPEAGEIVETTGQGTLTIEGVARPVEVALQATVRGERLVVAGASVIMLADFDVAVPTAPIVLGVADDATIEWQVFLSRT